MIEFARQNYPTRDTQARSLAKLVADQLRAAITTKHRATLAVPGGTTPAPFLEALSDAELDWQNVDVILTDERLVPKTSERSNTRLVREHLLRGGAQAARLLHYHGAATGIAPLLEAARARLTEVLPIDVLVLGMGADCHVASLFPGAPELPAALAADAPVLLVVQPPRQPEARLSLSASVLRSASIIHILITGAEKAAALEQAAQIGPLEEAPVRAVLTAGSPVTVHFAD